MTLPNLDRKDLKLFAWDAVAQDNLSVFGSLASSSPQFSKDIEIIQSLDYFMDGWASAIVGDSSPALEDMNSLFYVLFYQMAYLFQKGIPQWKDTTDYYTGSFTTDGAGALYVSLTDNNVGHDPKTDTGTNWTKFPTPAQVNAKVSRTGDTMTGSLKMQDASISMTTAFSRLYFNQAPGVPLAQINPLFQANVASNGLLIGEATTSAGLLVCGQEGHKGELRKLNADWVSADLTSEKSLLLTKGDIIDGAFGFPDFTAGYNIVKGMVLPCNSLVVGEGYAGNWSTLELKNDISGSLSTVGACGVSENSARYRATSCVFKKNSVIDCNFPATGYPLIGQNI